MADNVTGSNASNGSETNWATSILTTLPDVSKTSKLVLPLPPGAPNSSFLLTACVVSYHTASYAGDTSGALVGSV